MYTQQILGEDYELTKWLMIQETTVDWTKSKHTTVGFKGTFMVKKHTTASQFYCHSVQYMVQNAGRLQNESKSYTTTYIEHSSIAKSV